MTARHVRRLLPALGMLYLLGAGCAKAPPNLSPQANVAFQKTRVIKALDLARDFAIDGEAQVPKVVSTKTTRDIVLWHQSSLKVMQASDTGWVEAVNAGLTEVVNKLEPAEKQKFTPYVVLVQTILREAVR
jgi:hypothetical protein